MADSDRKRTLSDASVAASERTSRILVIAVAAGLYSDRIANGAVGLYDLTGDAIHLPTIVIEYVKPNGGREIAVAAFAVDGRDEAGQSHLATASNLF